MNVLSQGLAVTGERPDFFAGQNRVVLLTVSKTGALPSHFTLVVNWSPSRSCNFWYLPITRVWSYVRSPRSPTVVVVTFKFALCSSICSHNLEPGALRWTL